jgi:hypothetical protein
MLASVTQAAYEKLHARVDGAVQGGLEAYATRETDGSRWAKAKRDVSGAGPRALERLLSIASSDSARAPAAFALLRGATGELIPDDLDAWRAFLAAR